MMLESTMGGPTVGRQTREGRQEELHEARPLARAGCQGGSAASNARAENLLRFDVESEPSNDCRLPSHPKLLAVRLLPELVMNRRYRQQKQTR